MPLSQLPKDFGLVEMKKGYFPHLYNMKDNNMLECKKWLMHLPNPSYYDIDNIAITSLCMGTFCAKFLPEEWIVLYKKDAQDKDMGLQVSLGQGKRIAW